MSEISGGSDLDRRVDKRAFGAGRTKLPTVSLRVAERVLADVREFRLHAWWAVSRGALQSLRLCEQIRQ